MENQSNQSRSFGSLLRWAITPPQAYVVYLLCVVLVGGASFYVGTLKPNRHPNLPPAPANAPMPK
ncbi:hypothetical protein LPW26_21090 [Rhodopseudomonas sp. HC1]|nr:hypothetical protein [Rhodopseudomonas infernalis]